ncbi:hypothetical protein OC25_13170 [Pedobacter kyungheensis]|uniref:Uncharacterized protein n=1 Tax=Pedobacter kyungheensis TaxID=1069985 RepID=A0A0C1D7Y3_9SPHI|nr:hypothetical protein [Pedobacter kyungheensis]KIA93381.1 hypothetical protein OC25_13170 [Pedobacter kyungheensis]
MKTEIDFDDLNVFVRTKIPTNYYLKIFLFLFNTAAIIGLFWFAFSLQEEKPNVLPFLLPVGYFFTLGKYLLWNTFGQEFYIISTTHISYQHNYGFWTTKLKTAKYYAIDQFPSKENEGINLIFQDYTEEKLPIEVFSTALAISVSDSERIFNRLKEIKVDEFGEGVNFPKIFAN